MTALPNSSTRHSVASMAKKDSIILYRYSIFVDRPLGSILANNSNKRLRNCFATDRRFRINVGEEHGRSLRSSKRQR